MKTQILKQEKNPFLNREEITLEIEALANPSFEDVKNEIGKDAELTVVKKISGHFGRGRFIAEVFVYDSKEAKEKIEVLSKKQKEAEAKKQEEQKIAEKQEETKSEEVKPTEEQKEETPKEVKVEEKVEEVKNGN